MCCDATSSYHSRCAAGSVGSGQRCDRQQSNSDSRVVVWRRGGLMWGNGVGRWGKDDSQSRPAPRHATTQDAKRGNDRGQIGQIAIVFAGARQGRGKDSGVPRSGAGYTASLSLCVCVCGGRRAKADFGRAQLTPLGVKPSKHRKPDPPNLELSAPAAPSQFPAL